MMVTPPFIPSRLAFSITKVKELRDATRFLQFHISLLQSATISKVQEILDDLLTAASRVERLLKRFGSDAKKERDVGFSEGVVIQLSLYKEILIVTNALVQGVRELDITAVEDVVQDLENLIRKAEEVMEVWRKIETKLGGNRRVIRWPRVMGGGSVNVPDDEDWLGAFENKGEKSGMGDTVGKSKRKRGGLEGIWKLNGVKEEEKRRRR